MIHQNNRDWITLADPITSGPLVVREVWAGEDLVYPDGGIYCFIHPNDAPSYGYYFQRSMERLPASSGKLYAISIFFADGKSVQALTQDYIPYNKNDFNWASGTRKSLWFRTSDNVFMKDIQTYRKYLKGSPKKIANTENEYNYVGKKGTESWPAIIKTENENDNFCRFRFWRNGSNNQISIPIKTRYVLESRKTRKVIGTISTRSQLEHIKNPSDTMVMFEVKANVSDIISACNRNIRYLYASHYPNGNIKDFYRNHRSEYSVLTRFLNLKTTKTIYTRFPLNDLKIFRYTFRYSILYTVVNRFHDYYLDADYVIVPKDGHSFEFEYVKDQDGKQHADVSGSYTKREKYDMEVTFFVDSPLQFVRAIKNKSQHSIFHGYYIPGMLGDYAEPSGIDQSYWGSTTFDVFGHVSGMGGQGSSISYNLNSYYANGFPEARKNNTGRRLDYIYCLPSSKIRYSLRTTLNQTGDERVVTEHYGQLESRNDTYDFPTSNFNLGDYCNIGALLKNFKSNSAMRYCNGSITAHTKAKGTLSYMDGWTLTHTLANRSSDTTQKITISSRLVETNDKLRLLDNTSDLNKNVNASLSDGNFWEPSYIYGLTEVGIANIKKELNKKTK